MGDAVDEITRAGQQNRSEGRVVIIQAGSNANDLPLPQWGRG